MDNHQKRQFQFSGRGVGLPEASPEVHGPRGANTEGGAVRGTARRLLAALKPADRRETQAILGNPPESVGRLMTPDHVRGKPD
jgi:hypothetical protein